MIKNKYQNNDSAVFYYPTIRGGVDLLVQEAGYESCDPGHAWGPDKKSGYCFHYCLLGKGKIVINNKVHEINKGQLFYCGDGVSYYEADKDEPWEYIWVIFTGILAKSLISKTCLSNDNPVIDDKDGTLKSNFLQILNASETNENYYLFTTAYMYLIIANITRMYKNDSISKIDSSANVDQAIGYIVSNITVGITVDSLAKKVALCRSQLYRVFMSKTGYSPKEYITIIKIVYAAELIKNGIANATNAAAEVGYNDYNSFSKSFKRIIGASPTEFIQLNRESKFVQNVTYQDFLKVLEKK